MGSSPYIRVTTLPILANDRCFFTRQNNFQMNWSLGSQKGFEELKPGDCSCNMKYFKYFKLEYCKANRRKVGMGCTSLPAFLSFQSYCSPSTKGKNLVYLPFLAQAFCLLSHLLTQSTTSSLQLSKSKDPPWAPNPAKETGGRCQHFWSYSPSAKTHTWLGQQNYSSKIQWGQQTKATQSQCLLLSLLAQGQVKDQ